MLIVLFGTACLVLVVLSIIQQRKIRVLRHDKQAFRTLAENSPDLIFRYNRQGRRLYVNPAVARLLRTPEEELIGQSPADSPVFDSVQNQKLVDGICHVFETGETEGVEVVFTDQEGRSFYYSILLIPECDAAGQVNTVLGLSRDITAIREAERLVSNLVAQLPGFVFKFRMSADGHMSYPFASPRLEEFFGLRPKDVEDNAAPLHVMIHPEDAPRIASAIVESARMRSRFHVEYRLLRPGYPERWMEIIANPEQEADGSALWYGIHFDITERKRAELQLATRKRELCSLMENIPDHIARFSPDARAVYFNGLSSEHFSDRLREDLLGKTPMECFPDGRFAEYERRILATAATGGRDEIEMPLPMTDGTKQYHLIRFIAERDESGAVVSVLVIGTDITERKRAEEKLRLAASVFTNANEGIIVTDADNRILDANAAFTRITGYAREDVIGRNPNLLRSGRQGPEIYAELWLSLERTGSWAGEIWNQRKNGEVYVEWLTISVVKNEQGELRNYVGVFTDITQIKEHEQQLKRIAHYDALTGLPNRLLFMDRLKQAVAQARRTGGVLAVCYGDLDGFKPVNDRFGHEAGDVVLVTIGGRMQESVRAVDTVGRFGGDEFVLLLLNLESDQDCEMILIRLLDAVAQPIRLDGHSVSVTASLGVALFPQNDADPDALLRHADQAMYLAKRSGKSSYHFFGPGQL